LLRPKTDRSSLPEYSPKSKLPTTLEQIVADTRAALPFLHARRAQVERAAADRPLPPSFHAALTRSDLAVIAEVKRRSPSAGTINAGLDPAARAAAYADAGAAAVSVLTDVAHFGGSIDDLRAAAAGVAIPCIRKDFIVDELQIVEAKAVGAAAVLLIVRSLPLPRLRALREFTESLGLGALVEAHDARELEIALESGASIVGVNSRDLDTFRIDTAAAWTLVSRIPASCIAVAESGMAKRADVEAAAASGADAVLVGTALSALGEPSAAVAALAGVPRQGR